MNEFSDSATDRGIRKKTAYLDDQRARLALSIPRADGGVLQIPLLADTKATQEQEDIQRNTLIAIVPLARLPGYDAPEQSPRGALPRRGRIYVFRQNKLWRELETDGQGQLFEVDLTHWRSIAEQNGLADQREAVGAKQHIILLPMLLQSRFVADQFQMAYSELPWSWEYIKWLESDPARIKSRSQNMARAWDTAVVGSDQWKTTQANPSLPMTRIKSGLRARDFNTESSLEDPLDFKPSFAAFDEQMLMRRLQTRQEQLATHLKQAPPPALPDIGTGVDLLEHYNLRESNHLVGVILEDPLFALRHATAQIRHCTTYLQTLNALVQHRPFGRYAQVLYSILGGPLSSLKNEIDVPKLHETVFEQDRKTCRLQIATHLARLVSLLDKKIPVVMLDWTHRHDEALLEPYSLLAEALAALNQLPKQADAMYTGEESEILLKTINTLIQHLLRGEHPLGELLLSKNAEHMPETVKRLQALRNIDRIAEPEAMGLSTLMLTADVRGEVDWASAGKGLSYFIGDLIDIFGASVVAHVGRLSQSAVNIRMDRVFTPTFNTLSQLSSKIAGIRLTTFGDALARDYVVIGVQGNGLRNGLTPTERSTLTRKNFRYASLHSLGGEKLASTSPKSSYTSKPLTHDLNVIAVPKNHPELAHYSRFRLAFSEVSQALESTKIVPTLMVGFALYNLVVQVEAHQSFKTDGEALRGIFGIGSAIADLSAAIGNHSRLILGAATEHYLLSPRINVAKIAPTWATRLKHQTGSFNLSLLRAIGGGATIIGATLSALDAYRSLKEGNNSQAAAYLVAMTGGAAWAAYALGLTINPFALIIGAAFTIGGTIAANLLSDSDAELVIRNGPFGKRFKVVQQEVSKGSTQFKHLNDPIITYQQLVGIIGRPKIIAMRLIDWRDHATPEHLRTLELADQLRLQKIKNNSFSQTIRPDGQRLKGGDWIVIINSKVLAMLDNENKRLQVHAEEFYSSLDTGQAYSVRKYKRQAIGLPKLAAIALDNNNAVYVFPSSLEAPALNMQQRHRYRMTEGLKIEMQLELQSDPDTPPLVLPQPSPKQWKPFTTAHRYRPIESTTNKTSLYWQIEINELPR